MGIFGGPWRIGFPSEVGCHIYRTTNQSINSATWTAVSFDAERYDDHGLHEGVTNPTRITIIEPGRYLLIGSAHFAFHATGLRAARILLNGSTVIAEDRNEAIYRDETNVAPVVEWDLDTDDYVELQVYQNRGGALNVLALASYSPYFIARLAGV